MSSQKKTPKKITTESPFKTKQSSNVNLTECAPPPLLLGVGVGWGVLGKRGDLKIK